MTTAMPKYYDQAPSPAYVMDEGALIKNLELLRYVQQKANIEIILALKGFSLWHVFPLVKQYLAGATASSLNEARLIHQEMGVKAHTYSPAYPPQHFTEILSHSSHLTFNSLRQFHQFYAQTKATDPAISCGLRINPEYSEVETSLYNPCSPGSRLGETHEQLGDTLPEGIEGLHFHALCESSSYELEKTLKSFEQLFGKHLPFLKWVNMGGGHLITRKGYDVEHLIALLRAFQQRHPHLQIILEPGSAIAWDTGVLVSTVLDVFESKGIRTLILDVSFTAHLPDVLEMPYRPRIVGASATPIAGKPTYRIGGLSCLSGDFIEEYSFENPVNIGDRIIFEDMIHYTMVKTTMFNGVAHPDIAIWRNGSQLDIVRTFNYEDYKMRLG